MRHLESPHIHATPISRLLPDLPRPTHTALAQFLAGVVASGSILLAQAASAAPGPQAACTKERRFQRLLANDRFPAIDEQPSFRSALLAGRRGRLPVYLDCTVTQVDETGKGVITLMLAIAVHDRAQPLLWHCWAPGTANGAVMDMVGTLCDRLADSLPPGLTPVLMADRGFGAAELIAITDRLGWHILTRVKKGTRIRRSDGTIVDLASLATEPGTFVGERGVQLFGPTASGRAGYWATWDEAPIRNVIAAHPGGDDDDPWLLVTDLPPTRQRTVEYGHRTRIEELFRDLKSYGWQWQRSRITRPARMMRQLGVLALATWWVTERGTAVIRQGLRRRFDPGRRRRLSRFRLGMRWIEARCAQHKPIRCRIPVPPLPAET